jgi:hypothetical protein
MRLIERFLLAAVLAVAAVSPAHASFHLWALSELYSNADGSVQFLELTAITGAQEFVAGHTLTSSSGGTRHSFTVPRDLPGDTSGRKMLFGTQGFADLGVVTPDFIVPNGFFFTGGGTVTWAEGSDVWDHPALPTDGDLSLLRGGNTASNSPTNFARNTGHVTLVITPPAAALNVEGLWWRSPAGSESGWGVNLTQQGDILFATWFTYGSDHKGLWLVMSNGQKSGTNAWTGQLFRTTGPAFSAPFNSAPVGLSAVGTATFTFTDENNGTFAYTVNGISQSKPITRQVFASSVPTCAEGATPGTPNFQDLWWNAPAGSESGWGVNLIHQGNIIFATWFTYDSDHNGLWLVASAATLTAPNTYSGELFRTTGPAFDQPFNSAPVTITSVGTATFTFSDRDNGTFAYTVNGVSQTKPITRQVFSTPTTVCR